MKLNRIAFTGADDSVTPDDLVKIHEKYPFVEWGILTKGDPNLCKPRFPSQEFKDVLHDYLCTGDASVALHVCSSFAESLASGHVPSNAPYIDKLLLEQANRVQLNCREEIDLSGIHKLKSHPREWIIVAKRSRARAVYCAEELNQCGIHASVLFDQSGGKGILPDKLERPVIGVYTGYAGGLNAENLEAELTRIHNTDVMAFDRVQSRFETEVWIDMETGVRSGENGEKFDLAKVEECIQIALPWVAERVKQ